MARFKADQVDNYGGQGGSGFLQLKNDKEIATVRFMYESIDDVVGYSVHTVYINGKKRYVNCLREYNQPIDDCPFCREKMFTSAKLFIPVYDVDEDTVKIWERGKKFFSKISSLCARYPNMVSNIFEIERNGKPKETTTTYEIYHSETDETTLDDLPDLPKIVGGIVMDKTAEDMEYYLEEGQFPPDEEEEPIRRRSGRRMDEEDPTPEVPKERRRNSGRRTPARGNRETF